ncbi:metalloendoproteinase 1 [Phtheirospermum japonicum]|uniref:Metalloendoproteinase 1 n=1 Tax=Phtheirospermum japonicum TaxID=374723 RepID=A0A830D8U3_9LAMI|nr:metalloendoproteinase 1 [Phtheirospermum japonicum]GFQ02772.1 metalloendoproteinase 1 [Phtheirospermum japonicum]
MTPNSSCIFLFFALSCFILCQAHYPSTLSNTNSPSPLDFLKDLNGTQKGDQEKGLAQLKKHLANLGYIDQTNPKYSVHMNDDIFDDTLEQAIKKYQDFYKINVTGILDSQTVTSMLQPRCGVADILNNRNASSLGNIKFVLYGSKWPPNKRELTVSFPKGTRGDVYDPVKNALARWTSVSPFKFKFTDNFQAADVKMSFQRRDHGDGAPFAYPPYGILHFDVEESWATYAQKGQIDIQTVALHELGHVLGLAHSQDPKAVMFPSIGPGEKKDLSSDDIEGIRALYK